MQYANGKKYALSLAGAANLAGYVPEGDYARGNLEAARNREVRKVLCPPTSAYFTITFPSLMQEISNGYQ